MAWLNCYENFDTYTNNDIKNYGAVALRTNSTLCSLQPGYWQLYIMCYLDE